MPMTLLEYSLPMNDRYAARQTSQFAPIPRRKIWCQAGVMAFAVPKVTTRACWTGWLKVPPYPNMMAMTKSEPARLPQNVMNQCSSIFQGERRRCRAAMVVS